MNESARTRERPWTLLRAAAGSPAQIPTKLRRFGETLRAWFTPAVLDERFELLRRQGLLERAPNRVQLVLGCYDMLRFWISPASADYYAQKGISFTFHQVLRVLDDPAAMIDPVGFFVDRDAIVGHVLQVVHANPIYDVQLLSSHPGGVQALIDQTGAMLDGTHPRYASIGAIVEDPEYHARLLAFVHAFTADPLTPPPIRENVAQNPERYAALERTFGTLPAAMRYFCRLPEDLTGALRHAATVTAFPLHFAEP